MFQPNEKPIGAEKYRTKTEPATLASRAAAVVFGVYLSARAAASAAL